MPDLGIFFAHFTMNEATRVNLESFRRWHPDGPVIPVTASDETFEGGYFAKDFKLWDPDHAWYNADYPLYHAYLSCPVKCQRWFFVEWDCHCNMPVREYFRHVWDFDFVAPSIRLPYREPEWAWFKEFHLLPEKFRPFAMGVVPLNGIMVSDRALAKIIPVVLQERLAVQCELRIATVGNFVGHPPVANPLGNTMTWSNNHPQIIHSDGTLPPGIWHPVKVPLRSKEERGQNAT
jgi:hypothetical protein